MKKLLSLIVLFFICISQLQIGVVYATEQTELINTRQEGKQVLQGVGAVIEDAVEQLDGKLQNTEKSEQLEGKRQEVEDYLDQVQEEIASETSSEDIQEKVEEAKKVVVLKVVSGVTTYSDIGDSIDSEVANTYEKIEEASQILQDALVDERGKYSLIIKTKSSKNKIIKTLGKLDEGIAIEFMYASGKEKYFEIFFDKDSIFSQEMFEDIELGILPESFIGMEIVSPEIFSIEGVKSAEKVQKNLLQGEDLTEIWGIEEYQTYKYFSETKKASKKIRVGVVDTGIDYNHPDLQDRILVNKGRDFVNKDRDAMDDQGHGTHVAGTIAAAVNKQGIIGINPYVKLVPLKICSESGFCPTYAILRALNYATKKDIDILNMSLGGRGNPDDHPICDAIAAYSEMGGIVVVAAGNSNVDTSTFVPGGCSESITVQAHDRSGVKATFSNYGEVVDTSAPGVEIYSTFLNEGYKKLSGTSMAAPHVTGLVSLIQSYDDDITSGEVRSLLRASGNDIDSLMYNIRNLDTPIVVEEEELLLVEEIEEGLTVEKEIVEELREGEEVIFEAGTISELTPYEPIPTPEKTPEVEIEYEQLPQEPVTINFFEQEQGVDISNLNILSSEEEVLSLELETKEILSVDGGSKSFDESGAIIDQTQINTLDRGVEVQGLEVGDDFDIYNLPELQRSENSGIEINSYVEDITENIDVFIDGAEKGIEINSQEQGEEIIFLSGSLDFDNETILDEIGNLVDVSDFETIQIQEEILEPVVMTEELFLQETGSDIQINSVDPLEYNVSVETGKELIVHLPDSTQYKPFVTSIDSGTAHVATVWWKLSDQAKITAGTIGNVRIDLKDPSNIIQHIIYVTITPILPPPPEIKILTSVYETKSFLLRHEGLQASVSDASYIAFTRSSSYLHMKALKAGDVEIYMRDSSGVHTITYQLHINPAPTPQSYNVELLSGGSTTLHIPESTYNFNVAGSGDWIFDNKIQYATSFYFSTKTTGEYIVRLVNKTTGFDAYVITITSSPQRENYILNISDNLAVWGHSSYSFVEEDSSIVVHDYDNGHHVLDGRGVGNTQINIFKDGGLRKIWNVTVNPIPAPIEIDCSISVGESCDFSINNDGFYFTQDKIGTIDVAGGTNAFDVEAYTSGNATVYVRSATGEYITHKINVNVFPKTVISKDFSIPEKLEGSLTNFPGKFGEYNFTVSQEGILSARIVKETYNDGMIRAKVYIKGLSNGQANLYIHRNADHVGTIVSTILPEIKPIRFDDHLHYLDEDGEKADILILEGGGKYEKQEYEADKIYFSLGSDKDSNGVYLPTGDATVKGLKKSNGGSYAYIKDQHGQRAYLAIYVNDVSLRISEHIPTLSKGQTEYIEVLESYKGVATINEHIPSGETAKVTAYLVRLSDGNEYIKVIGKNPGVATIEVTDKEGNFQNFNITVEGGDNEEIDIQTPKIRYIRDWLQGSNKNSYSHWMEIQAIEKTTGVNIAEGKIVTSLHESKVGYPYSRISDGNINSYSEGSSTQLSWVQLDLGSLYDIERVKIWHYYPDSRTYNKTKTEVSSDGVTWYTLFDSTTEGVYIEPTDGSGRSYDVRNILENDISTIEKLDVFLELLLSESEISSIQYSSTDGIEINSNIGEILEEYSRIRYEAAWQDFAESYSDFAIYKNPFYTENNREGINLSLLGFQGKLYSSFRAIHPDTLEYRKEIFESKLTALIYDYDPIRNQNNLNVQEITLRYYLYQDIRRALNYTFDKAIKDYWESNPEELEQKRKDALFDVANALGLENAGQTWGAMSAIVISEITNDPYLSEIAKQEFLDEIAELTNEYTDIESLVLRKALFIKRLGGFGKNIKIATRTSISNAILTKNLAGKTLRTGDGKSMKIPINWVKNDVSGNGGGARYVNPEGTIQIRVMGEGVLDSIPYTKGKPYFRIEELGTNKQLNFDFTYRSSWTDNTSHYLINKIQ